MRIAMVCPYSLSTLGGVQEQVTGLTRALVGMGHAVEVIAPGCGDRKTSMGMTLPFRVNGSIAPMAPHPAAAARTVQALARGRFDVIHLHEPLAPSITIPALIHHAAPVVGTFHAAGERTPYRWLGAPLRRLARRIDVRVAVSEPAAELARRHLGGTYEVLFNGIDLAAFTETPPTEIAGPSVLFLGRHESRKGLYALLEAASMLPLDVTVLIAGSGPETEQLRHRYSSDKRIRWLGRLSAHEKIQYLRGASVLCAPSLHGESFGVVLLEAMAAGTPVVASDLPGYREVSENGAAALLVPPGAIELLASALCRLLTDHRLADSLRASGRQIAIRSSMNELAHRYEDLYRKAGASSEMSLGKRPSECD